MKKLPRFGSVDAFARFVETHDLADYWDEFEPEAPLELSAALRRRIEKEAGRMKLVALRLPPVQVHLAKATAKRNRVSCSTQLRLWLTRGMNEDLGRRRRARAS